MTRAGLTRINAEITHAKVAALGRAGARLAGQYERARARALT